MKLNKTKTIILILTCITFIFGLYFISNFNKIKIYEFEGTGSIFYVKGNATFNNQINLLNITNISTDYLSDMKIKGIYIAMYADCKKGKRIIFASGFNTKDTPTQISIEEDIYLKDYLEKATYTIRENYGYEEYFTDEIINNFGNIVYLEIEYIDENNESHIDTIQLTVNKISNNKFIYSKSPHI